MEISPDEAFLMLHKWQVELTQVLLVGSLMPNHPLRGLVAVVTREGVWSGDDKPTSIWGFLLKGQKADFLASDFKGFEYVQPRELSTEIRASLRLEGRDCPVLALAKEMKLPRLPRIEHDSLATVRETLLLVEDDAGRRGDAIP